MKENQMAAIGHDHQPDSDVHQYSEFLDNIQAQFNATIEVGSAKLFTTDAVDLFDKFLANLPDEDRQHYTCHACRRFVDTFGGLVVMVESGETEPAVWPQNVPPYFSKAVAALRMTICRAKVTGVFLDTRKTWGEPVTGEWNHMAVKLAKPIFAGRTLQTAGQVMAEKLEDFRILSAGLAEFNADTVAQAVRVLESDALYRSEKVLGVAKFLQDLHQRLSETKNKRTRENLVWLAVANAPAGFCHVRSSMIGTLLEDIAVGLPFDDVARKFADKMHPLRYQRPQATPSAGNIAEAEKVVEKLGIAGSLARRFAKVEELQAIWRPSVETEKAAGSVFGHLKAKEAAKQANTLQLPIATMTWDKFARTVLQNAKQIELRVPSGYDSFAGIITAANPDAPPIIQWDRDDQRNPFSWYLYSGGSPASRWGLAAGGYRKVTAVCETPCHWNGKAPNYPSGTFLILEGAKDLAMNGLALFPEILKSDLHGICATIEAFSNSGKIEGAEDATACGLYFTSKQELNYIVRVTTDSGVQEYKLDRWD